MKRHAEVAIVGGGIMGACAAWRLASAGHDVALFERFSFGGDRGSSHGATRVFRYAYGDPTYTRMAQASVPYWRELGDDLIAFTGGVDAGDPVRLDAIEQSLTMCGAEFERVDAARFDWLSLEPGTPALYSPDGGVIAAARALDAAISGARAAGAQLYDNAHVRRVLVGEDGNALLDVEGTGAFVAVRAIVAAGAWCAPMLAPLGLTLPLRVTEESVFYFDSSRPIEVFISWDEIPWYVVPSLHGAPGVKVGEHGNGPVVDPETRRGVPDAGAGRRAAEHVRQTLPVLAPQIVAAETCLYTNAPQDRFVLDVRGPIVVASPCSGHGFKFAPLLGEVLACLATGRTSPIDTSAFRLGRVGRW